MNKAKRPREEDSEPAEEDSEPREGSASELPDSDVMQSLPILIHTPAILDQLLRDLLVNQETASTTSSLIRACLSSIMEAYPKSFNSQVDAAVGRLSAYLNDGLTPDDFEREIIPFFKDIDTFRAFPVSTGKNKIVWEMFFYLIDNTQFVGPYGDAAAEGRAAFDEGADKMLVEIAKARKEEEGNGEQFLIDLNETLTNRLEEAAQDNDGYFPQLRQLFLEWTGKNLEEEEY